MPQFRLAHAFQPRIRQTIEAELPGLAEALEHAGCLRFNPFRALPHALTGGFAPSDERFDMLTGRRPVVEGILAGVALRTPGLVVRRGVAATGLLVDPYRTSSVHVGGVATSTGETLPADLVVDAAGRRSPLGDLLQAAGARRPQEETVHDAGYVYYGARLPQRRRRAAATAWDPPTRCTTRSRSSPSPPIAAAGAWCC